MKNCIALIFFFSLLTNFITAQSFVKQWDKRYGGYDADQLNDFILTNDQGFLLAGWTYSNAGGDITESSRDSTFDPSGDYWIIKLDATGTKQWEKRFGGSNEDILNCVIQTNDGGYLLGGNSKSWVSGDKSENSSGQNYWVIKIDSIGRKQWDKTFGTVNGSEELFSIVETGRNQYILAGISEGGISGDKTDTSRGGLDYWIIKIDSTGNKLWDKTYGGSNDDYLQVVITTNDHGYILSGGSMSGISGDKTQPDWDSTHASFDFWIVKIDSLGNKQWDKRYGGIKGELGKDIKQTNDGGYVIGGTSSSPISGDKTQNYWGNSNPSDYWIIKTDSAGNKQWDKRYGGDNYESLRTVNVTSDEGYLLGGLSRSNNGGDKTEDNLNYTQLWVVKTNTAGDKEWDKTMFTLISSTIPNQNMFAFQTKDDCYVAANANTSDSGAYKSQPNWGSSDWWVIKFCMDSASGITEQTNNESFTLFPNPVTSRIMITTTQTTTNPTITITTTAGAVVMQTTQFTGNKFEIDVSAFPAGLYFLSLQDEKARVVRRFVKE